MSTDDLEDRLRRLGHTPIAPDVEAAHRRAIAQAAPSPARARFGWKAVALAALVGFFAGSTALASAGSLPDPAQDIAHGTLGAVGIDVPRSHEGCPEGTSYRNHGEYIAAVEAAGGDVRGAAHSDCGKPGHADKGKRGAKGAPGATTDRDGDPCTGPPPWAGSHLDPAAKAAAHAEREATCGPEDETDEPDEGDEVDRAPASDSATTTTAPDATTTTASDQTTTTTAAPTTTTTTDTSTTPP
jgi:hypothetical protein